MSKSVLCAIDISQPEIDKHVLKRAAQLAKMDGASMDVITVIPDYGLSIVGSFFDETHHKKVLAEATNTLNKFVSEVLGDEANKDIRHLVATGSAYEQILNAANTAGTTLIVIGSHKPELSDYLLGPNAARVVRHSTCSVHVVR